MAYKHRIDAPLAAAPDGCANPISSSTTMILPPAVEEWRRDVH
jgi:hypothetical protein